MTTQTHIYSFYIHTIIFSFSLIITMRHLIRKDWERFSTGLLVTILLTFALVTHLYGFQMWHFIGSDF